MLRSEQAERDYAELSRSSTTGRRAFTDKLFAEMLKKRGQYALQRLELLAAHMLDETSDIRLREREKESGALGTLPQGYFRPESSLEILDIARVRGFLKGIQEVPHVRTAVDIGTGASALLALGTAAFHHEARYIQAIEINEQSARCAERLVQLCGYEGIIEVVVGDGLNMPLESCDFAVSETFNAGLGYESGVPILHRYSEVAATILPARADMYAAIIPKDAHDVMALMQKVDTIDFRHPKALVEGTLSFNPDHVPCDLRVMSLLYSAANTELIKPGDDFITSIEPLVSFDSSSPTSTLSQVYFSYEHSNGSPASKVRVTEAGLDNIV